MRIWPHLAWLSVWAGATCYCSVPGAAREPQTSNERHPPHTLPSSSADASPKSKSASAVDDAGDSAVPTEASPTANSICSDAARFSTNRDYHQVSTRPLFASERTICFCSDCDHSWWYAKSAAPTQHPPGEFPTVSCARPGPIGYLLGTTESATFLLSAKRDQVLRHDSAGGHQHAQMPLGSVALGLAKDVPFALLNSNTLVRLRGRAQKPGVLLSDSTAALWASPDWLVWQRKQSVEAMRPDGTLPHPLTTHTDTPASISACGSPITGDTVLAFDQGSVVGVALSPKSKSWWVRVAPLTAHHCFAATEDTLVVSGQQRGMPALAIFTFSDSKTWRGESSNAHEQERDGFWEVLPLPWATGILEPRFVGKQLIVSAPEEAVLHPQTGARVRAAGALYILRRPSANQPESWQIDTRVIAREPRHFGLFGFQAVGGSSGLLVNYLVDDPNDPERLDFGTPETCLLPKSPRDQELP